MNIQSKQVVKLTQYIQAEQRKIITNKSKWYTEALRTKHNVNVLSVTIAKQVFHSHLNT